MSIVFPGLLPAGVALAVHDDALLHHQHRCYNVPENARSAAELEPFSGGDVASDLSAYDSNADLNLGFHLAVLSHEQRVRTQDLTAKLAVEGECPNKAETSFRLTTAINYRRRSMVR